MTLAKRRRFAIMSPFLILGGLGLMWVGFWMKSIGQYYQLVTLRAGELTLQEFQRALLLEQLIGFGLVPFIIGLLSCLLGFGFIVYLILESE